MNSSSFSDAKYWGPVHIRTQDLRYPTLATGTACRTPTDIRQGLLFWFVHCYSGSAKKKPRFAQRVLLFFAQNGTHPHVRTSCVEWTSMSDGTTKQIGKYELPS